MSAKLLKEKGISLHELFLGYLQSPLLSPSEYIAEVLPDVDKKIITSGHFWQNTKDWKAKKLEWQQRLLEDLYESEKKKMEKDHNIKARIERLNNYLEMVENSVAYIVINKRKTIEDKDGNKVTVLDRELSEMKDIKIAYDILRTATGKHTDKPTDEATQHVIVEYRLPDNNRKTITVKNN